MRRALLRLAAALLAGAITVPGFAPYSLFPLPLLTLAVLVGLWSRAARPREAAGLGFAFGLGLFLGGVSWIYVSLHDHGGMPAVLAALAVLLFSALLAVFPAVAGWAYARLRTEGLWRGALLAAAAWTLAEWLRGWVLSGFPWLTVGYTQSPPSPLAGFAPLVGAYGLSFIVVALAALLATAWEQRALRLRAASVLVAAMVLGYGLTRVEWTQPREREISVSLLQPNIPQSLKWQPELLGRWLRENVELVEAQAAQLVVLPETTLPLALDDLPPEYLGRMTQAARRAGGDVLFGIFTLERAASGPRYFNSAVSLGSSPSQRYSKSHLVAFGEFSPPGLGWVYQWLHIPMSDQSPGAEHQPPLALAGEQVAVNICYEDAFGAEIIRALPQATLLLNLTNTAWFGRSLAQPQHLQMSQLRALEAGRPMLRATNTGMTAVITPRGEVSAMLPPFEPGALTARVRGYSGLTPYARIGNWGAIGLAALVLLLGLRWRRSGNQAGGQLTEQHP